MTAPDYPSYQKDSPLSGPATGSESLAETAKADIATLGEEVSQQAASLSEEAKAQVGELAEKAKGMAGEQKDLLVTQISGVSEAIEKVASELEGQNQTSAQYVRMVADGASRLTSTLRDNSVDDVMSMAQDFGRRKPVAFLGAAALLGFAASRFVTASAHRQPDAGKSNAPAPTQPGSTAPGDAKLGGNDARY